jgi:hypothetical protein
MTQKYSLHRCKGSWNKFHAVHEDGRELFGDLAAIRSIFDKDLTESPLSQEWQDFVVRQANYMYGNTTSSTGNWWGARVDRV